MKSALFASLALFAAAVAHAERVGDVLALVSPAADAVDVPTNAAVIYRFSLFDPLPAPQIVAAADGVAVDVDVDIVTASTAGEGFVMIRPTAGAWPADASVAVAGLSDLAFTTGVGSVVVDDGPPTVTQVESIASFCFHSVGVDAFVIANLETDVGARLVYDLGGNVGESPDDGFTGTSTLVTRAEWTDAAPGATTQVRFAAVRIDGTFSAWGAPQTLRLPGDRDCDGVDDDHDACPDEAGASCVSVAIDGGCPDGASVANFRCEGGVLCSELSTIELPTCAEGGDDEEEEEDEDEDRGCGAGPRGSVVAVFVILLARRRRPVAIA